MFPNKNWNLGELKALIKKNDNWQHRYCCSTYWV